MRFCRNEVEPSLDVGVTGDTDTSDEFRARHDFFGLVAVEIFCFACDIQDITSYIIRKCKTGETITLNTSKGGVE